MSRSLRIIGLTLASLTIVTVALAQQSGGKGRSDAAPLTIATTDPGKARLSRLADPRRALMDCPAGVCDTPPKAAQAASNDATAQGNCGDSTVARDRNGKVIRRICQFF